MRATLEQGRDNAGIGSGCLSPRDGLSSFAANAARCLAHPMHRLRHPDSLRGVSITNVHVPANTSTKASREREINQFALRFGDFARVTPSNKTRAIRRCHLGRKRWNLHTILRSGLVPVGTAALSLISTNRTSSTRSVWISSAKVATSSFALSVIACFLSENRESELLQVDRSGFQPLATLAA